MKKEDIAGLIMYLLIIAVAVIYSFTVLRVHFTYSTFNATVLSYALYVIVSVISGIFLSAVFLEIGHIIGAKIGGYKIQSVNILYFNFYKEEDKWKFRFKSFDGLTGESKILPKDEKSKPTPYLITPTILLALLAIGGFVVFYVYNASHDIFGDLAYYMLTIAVIILIVLIYNLVPIKLDSKTDGYQLKIISGKNNKNVFNEMLTVGHAVEKGDKSVEVKEELKEVNNITAELSIDRVSILLDEEKYDEANQLIDKILENKHKVSAKNELRCLAIKIFIKAKTSSEEELVAYINENVDLSLRRSLSDDVSMSSIRAYILVAGLVDGSKSECLISINKVTSAFKSISKERKAAEANMYNSVIELINKKHPKWELDKYRLVL